MLNQQLQVSLENEPGAIVVFGSLSLESCHHTLRMLTLFAWKKAEQSARIREGTNIPGIATPKISEPPDAEESLICETCQIDKNHSKAVRCPERTEKSRQVLVPHLKSGKLLSEQRWSHPIRQRAMSGGKSPAALFVMVCGV